MISEVASNIKICIKDRGVQLVSEEWRYWTPKTIRLYLLPNPNSSTLDIGHWTFQGVLVSKYGPCSVINPRWSPHSTEENMIPRNEENEVKGKQSEAEATEHIQSAIEQTAKYIPLLWIHTLHVYKITTHSLPYSDSHFLVLIFMNDR